MSDTSRYGHWDSPISAQMVAAGGRRLQQPQVHDGTVYWTEGRPEEKGRITVACADADGTRRDLVPAPHSVRSRVNGYGGGAFAVDAERERVYFVDAASQDVYLVCGPDAPRRIGGTEGHAYGDLLLDVARDRLLCVRERMHGVEGDGPVEALIAMDLDDGAETVLRRGHDFYAAPCLSPDGTRLAYLTWNQPDMPWDATTLWLATLDRYGKVEDADPITAEGESVFGPWFDAAGHLVFASDRDDGSDVRRWQLYRCEGEDLRQLTHDAREHALPLWVPGMSVTAPCAEGVISASTADGTWRVDRISDEGIEAIELAGLSHVEHLTGDGAVCAIVGGSPELPSSLYRLDSGGEITVLARASDLELDPAHISRPEAMRFASGDGEAHGFLYRPTGAGQDAPEGSRPPLIVKCHGGPTAATSTALDLKIQYWTSRGFALLDLNYRGSTGYGRAYREALYGRWGIAEVEDAAAAVAALVERGEVDPGACFISGSSAGGYTVLRALMYTDVFTAGGCYYGVADLEAICDDTTRFEARYGDQLIAPYPAERERYLELSPIHHVEDLTRPVIFFQGGQDDIVPPDQTRRMAAALREQGITTEEHHYPNEGHGFRSADTIVDCLTKELAFFQHFLPD